MRTNEAIRARALALADSGQFNHWGDFGARLDRRLSCAARARASAKLKVSAKAGRARATALAGSQALHMMDLEPVRAELPSSRDRLTGSRAPALRGALRRCAAAQVRRRGPLRWRSALDPLPA